MIKKIFTEVFENKTEFLGKEDELLSKDFRLTNKTNAEELNHLEYYKGQWAGREDSFHGPVKYEITWCCVL